MSDAYDNIDVGALVDRIAEAIDDFSEANTVTVNEVLMSLEYVYATIERLAGDDKPYRMH